MKRTMEALSELQRAAKNDEIRKFAGIFNFVSGYQEFIDELERQIRQRFPQYERFLRYL